MSNYQFTYIIGYRHKPERLINLLRVLDWLQPFSGIEIIVVEQDNNSKLEYRDLRCKHIFTESDLPYNRSWAFNVGLKEASTNSIVFGDSDIIMDPGKLIAAITELKNYEAVNPYSRVIDLTPDELNIPMSEIFKIDRPGRGDKDNQKINFSGGIVCIRKDAALNIGAYDESFISWGCEDNFLTEKIFRFLKHKQMNANSYHLWHPQEQINQQLYGRNLQILNDMLKMSDEQMLAYVHSTYPLIGNKSKYTNF